MDKLDDLLLPTDCFKLFNEGKILFDGIPSILPQFFQNDFSRMLEDGYVTKKEIEASKTVVQEHIKVSKKLLKQLLEEKLVQIDAWEIQALKVLDKYSKEN